MSVFPGVHMPSLDGATGWLNSEPLGPAELRGHVVLVNFWTLTCINWLRQEPYVRAWSRAYRDDGLIVIGVHTPEFSFEHDIDLVRQAVKDAGHRLPGRAGQRLRVWTAFANHYWPALYFVDRDGRIRDQHFGEGRYEQSERASNGCSTSSASLSRSRVRASRRRPTGTTSARPRHTSGTAAAGVARATADDLRLNDWALTGAWKKGPENVVLDEAGGSSPSGSTHATPISFCLPGAREPIPFRVLLDGEAPGPSHGVDVDEEGNGVLREGRMYQLVRQHDTVRERTLEITFLEPGAEAYSFTFG